MTGPAPNNGSNRPNRIVAGGSWTRGSKPAPKAAPAPTPPPTPNLVSSILDKTKSVVDSYMSRGITQDKRADEETKLKRIISCHGDANAGIPPCPYRGDSKAEEGRYYCLECGCGDRQATWLNAKTPDDYTKLDFPRVVCPLQMPGFTNYVEADKEPPERCMRYDFTRKRQVEQHLVTLTIRRTDEKNST
jgi:hypothetical protein